MNQGFLEKLAIRETGRLSQSAAIRRGSRIIIYPGRLRYTDLIKGNHLNRRDKFHFIEYGVGQESGFSFVQYLYRLVPFLRGCRSIEFYLLSMTLDGKYGLLTAALGKLLGVPVTIYDFGFRNGFERKMRAQIDSVANNRIGGDVTLVGEYEKIPANISFRREALDSSGYQSLCKNRAVPHVMVYGDFGNSQVVALARRAHDIVKQKYPRTEFMLTSFDSDQTDYGSHEWGNSFYLCQPDSETALMKLFEVADTLLLLSAGGLNRFFLFRARAARFPIITNGINYADESGNTGEIITVVRDSYSSLAGEIVKLVDDEAYYKGIYTQ